ncbi:MAG: hypothetical protein ABIJ31_00140 [Pseudomonadota bacterium]
MISDKPLPDQCEGVRLKNRFIEQLPFDPDLTNTLRQVFGACYSKENPAKVFCQGF